MATVKVTEQKVILCGEYGVGKTSIFRRFANNTFVTSSDRKSTLGLDNIDKEYIVDERRIRVKLNIMLRQIKQTIITCFFFFSFQYSLVTTVGYWRYGASSISYIELLQIC